MNGKSKPTGGVSAENITQSILVFRGHKVLLDADLAILYGVSTTRLNQQVRRNLERFPEDFMFQLTDAEYAALMLQNATSSPGHGGRRKPPLAFTEHGAIMAATILSSPRAVEMGIYVVRAFVRLREVLASNRELARKLTELERSLAAMDLETQRQFNEVYEAIRALANPPTTVHRPIGFTADLEEKA